MRYRTGKYTVCRCVRAAFSPEIVQAGAVMGLNTRNNNENVRAVAAPKTDSVLLLLLFSLPQLLQAGCLQTAKLLSPVSTL